ncbi:MAG: hypothetical protein WBO95_15955, partial [Candidatus Dechloromonas phosphoritropha]
MTFQRFTGDNAALLLIDHQVGTMGWVTSAQADSSRQHETASPSRSGRRRRARDEVKQLGHPRQHPLH